MHCVVAAQAMAFGKFAREVSEGRVETYDIELGI